MKWFDYENCNACTDCPAYPKVMEYLHISNCMERASEFDIIHNQFDFMPLNYSKLIRTLVITAIHGLSSPEVIENKKTGFIVSGPEAAAEAVKGITLIDRNYCREFVQKKFLKKEWPVIMSMFIDKF